MKKISILILILSVAGACILTQLFFRSHARSKWREQTDAEQRLAERLAALWIEYQALSNRVFNAGSTPLSREDLLELMNLRDELGRLREQTNRVPALQAERHRLSNPVPAAFRPPEELEAELVDEIARSMSAIHRALPSVLERFGRDHNRMPNDFSELRPYFRTPDGSRMPGVYAVDFVRLQDAGVAVLADTMPRRQRDGTWARLYALPDGRILEARAVDGDFEAWEREHLPSMLVP
jgi:hypothetical protein